MIEIIQMRFVRVVTSPGAAIVLSFLLGFSSQLKAEPENGAQAEISAGDKFVAVHYMHGNSPDAQPKGLPSRQNGILGRPVSGEAVWSDSDKAAAWDVAQARASGIDAFALWIHPRLGENEDFTKANSSSGQLRLEALMEAIKKDGKMTFFPDFWWYRMNPENWGSIVPGWKRDPDPGVEAEMRRLGNLLKSWAEKYGNVWKKEDGRFVISMQDHDQFMNVPYEKAAEWLFGPLGGRKNVYLSLSRYGNPASDKIAQDWLAGADAILDWDANRSYGDSVRELPAGRDYAKAHNKSWWASFAPGFFVSRTGDATAPKSPVLYERLGVIAYYRAWMDAILHGANAVYLISWNDISEDTEIMPTSGHGYALQHLTRYLSCWYKTGQAPPIETEELLLFHHPQVVRGLKLPKGLLATIGNVECLTPPTDYVVVCSFLKEPADVSVFFQKDVVETKSLPAGFHAWLLYYPTLRPDGREAVYPASQDSLSVSVLDRPFKDMEVSVQIRRNNMDLGRYFSSQGVVSAAGRADMGTVGNVFRISP